MISKKDGFFYISKKDVTDKDMMVDIKRDLTCIVSSRSKYGTKTFSIWREIDKYYRLPRMLGINKFGKSVNIVNNISENPQISAFMETKIDLYDYQEEAVNLIKSNYESGGLGGILKFGCGGGKTRTSVACAQAIGKKTLIIVSGDDACDIFQNEIGNILPEIKTSIISREKSVENRKKFLQSEEYPIVISCYKTLLNNLSSSDFAAVDFVIMDEVHEYLTEISLGLFDLVSRRFILGLSATPTKPNGIHYLLDYFIGPILTNVEMTYTGATPSVKKIFVKYDTEFTNEMTFLDVQKIMLNSEHRTKIVCDLAIEHFNKGDTVLVIGLFREQLEKYKEYIDNVLPDESMLYYGESSKKNKLIRNEKLKSKRIILAVRKMGAQSLNIPDLNVMILANKYIPKNKGQNTEKIEQMCGRILRKQHEESPLIYDIVDDHPFFLNHWRECKKYYQSRKFNIILSNLSN